MSSYSHRIASLGFGDYEVSWTVDHKFAGSRLRFPRRCSRITDEAGARRFSKRWNVPMPGERDERAGGDHAAK